MTQRIPDPGDRHLALNALPLLRRHNEAGTLSPADVHVAQRLGRLTGEGDERVLLAVALAVRAVRAGSVCVRLADLPAAGVPDAEPADAGPSAAADPESHQEWPELSAWVAAVEASPMVAVGRDGPADLPVRWVDGRLYLDRYWRDEELVRREIDGRLLAPVPPAVDPRVLRDALERFFDKPGDSRQRLATAAAATGRLTVLTGGPGTGKTTTVARLLAVLQATADRPLRVALAAPTGKAAARLQEAVQTLLAAHPDVVAPPATTIHRLLGWLPGRSTRFRHGAGHHLPHDVVVVDETSMVSLPLMARLLEAVRPDARVVLVGDPDQLASVEAGAVLGDLVARPPVGGSLGARLASLVPHDVPTEPLARQRLDNGVVRLEKVHRFTGGIADLAEAVRLGDVDGAVAVLQAGRSDVELVEIAEQWPTDAEVAELRAEATAAGLRVSEAARRGDAEQALAALEDHRLLVAHRTGPAGVAYWTDEVARWVAEAAGTPGSSPWYPGRPLLVTANDRSSGLYNGDTGVLVDDGEGGVVAAFAAATAPHLVRPHRLPPVETVHAMTVHRAQGSQFATVSLILPPADSPLLTRELFYTALTRARTRVRVLGTAAAVRAAVARPVRRASGLGDRP